MDILQLSAEHQGSAAATIYPLCSHYGVDQEDIKQRLMMCGLGPQDALRLGIAREIIADHIDYLVDSFYGHLLKFSELSRFIADPQRLTGLRLSLIQYLTSLGQDMESQGYFEGRLRVGTTHEKIGILPKWYIVAISQMQSTLSVLIAKHAEEDTYEKSLVIASVQKALYLDIALAVETYHRTSMRRIEHLLKQAEQDQDQIRELAQTDQLTGLSNRRHFMELLDSEYYRSRRYDRSLCVLLLDLDDFKNINDTYGHHMGDEVLQRVGKLIYEQVRSSDFCGRLGGEELGIALVETPLYTAEMIADRIRTAIVREEFGEGEKRFSISTSVGLANTTSDQSNAADLLREADEALYRAKARGKNQVCITAIG